MKLKNYKVTHEDESHYHIKSDKGHEFKIEKSKMSKSAHKELSGITKYAKGGEAEAEKIAMEADGPVQPVYPLETAAAFSVPFVAPQLTASAIAAGSKVGKELMENPERGSFGSKNNNVPQSEFGNIIKRIDQSGPAKIPGYTTEQMAEIGKQAVARLQSLEPSSPQYQILKEALGKIGMPGFAEGGSVDPETTFEMPPVNPTTENARFMASAPEYLNSNAEMSMPTMTPAPQSQVSQPMQSQPQPQEMATYSQMQQSAPPGSGFRGAYENMMQAQQDLGQAKSNAALSESGALKTAYNEMSKMPTSTDIYKRGMERDAKLEQDFRETKLDPKRLWHNASTGQQVSTVLGMALAGIGSGLTGQPNMAYDAINKLIERDIEAQKTDQSNKFNLWKMNRSKVDSDVQADLLSKNQKFAALKIQLEQQVAASKSPIALAESKAALATINMEMAKNQQMFSFLSPQTQEATGGAAPGTEQAYINNLQRLKQGSVFYPQAKTMADDLSRRYIPGVGKASKDISPGKMDERASLQTVRDLAQELLQYQSQHKEGTWLPGEQKGQLEAKYSMLTGEASPVLSKIKRYNPDLAAALMGGAQSPTSLDVSGKNVGKWKAIVENANTQINALDREYGIQKFRTAPQDQQAQQWLQQNPNHPEAQRVREALRKKGI